MTNTFSVYAWCDRPFIAYLDEVEAETPEEAIALARQQPEQLLDVAEECNGQYPWDEFAAFDGDGRELLRVLDAEARMRNAAPELLAACRMVVDRWERGDLAEAVRVCAALIEECSVQLARIPVTSVDPAAPDRARFHYEAETTACQAADSVACFSISNEGGVPMKSSTPTDSGPPSGAGAVPKVRISLEGVDGNAFSLLGAWCHAAQSQGLTPEQIEEVTREATAGDYEHLLHTLQKYQVAPDNAAAGDGTDAFQ